MHNNDNRVHVSLVLVYNQEGRLLLGQRRDNGKWTLVGGGAKPGESPEKCAVREMREETGLTPTSLMLLGMHDLKDGHRIWTYRATVEGGPVFMVDPDLEMRHFSWIDIDGGIPQDVWENLHGPESEEENTLARYVGLQKSDPGFSDGTGDFPASPDGLPTIVVVRHGETDFNSKDTQSGERLRGWLDVPLNERGKEQAKEAANDLLEAPLGSFHSSDLSRAWETALAIHQFHNEAGIEKTASLRPWDMGEMNGKGIADVIPVMLHHIKNDEELIPGSCETFKHFQRRTLTAVKEVMDEAIAHPDRGWQVIVTHSRDCRLIKAWLMAGCRDIDVIDKTPLLEKKDNVETGRFMILRFVEGGWHEIQEHDISKLEKGAMQRIAPFNPQKTLTPEEESNVYRWQASSGSEKDRHGIPALEGAGRIRMLHKLSALTAVRNGANGREFLLHRGTSAIERDHMANSLGEGLSPNEYVNHVAPSSWTPKYSLARNFANAYHMGVSNVRRSPLVSAWVPEHAILSMPKQFGAVGNRDQKSLFVADRQFRAKGQNALGGENEIIVAPGHNSRLATTKEVQEHLNPTTSDARINTAGRAESNYGPVPAETKLAFLRSRYRNVKKSELQKMALADIKVGKPHTPKPDYKIGGREFAVHPGIDRDGKAWNYNHVLPKQHRKNYDLHVVRTPGNNLTAVLHGEREGKFSVKVGKVWAGLDPNTKTMTVYDASLGDSHRGKGLGLAMYEAVFAHAKNASGMKTVAGEEHSTSAGRVHSKLSAKHGMKYKAVEQPGEHFDPKDKERPYDNRYIGYNYALKAEEDFAKTELEGLEKMAIRDIPEGQMMSSDAEGTRDFDYNHVLSSEQKNAGYSLKVQSRSMRAAKKMVAYLYHNNAQIGYVGGFIGKDSIEPHTELDLDHHRKGLGRAMYEALYSHAFHNGIRGISGGMHTKAASRVHQSLATKHGLQYKPNDTGEYPFPIGNYSYTLKGEIDPNTPWKQPTGQTCPHGHAIFMVDGEHVRNHFDSDFVQGGNGFRYSWIPKGEIWISSETPPAEVPYVVEHECRESKDMAHGDSYDKAHDKAKAHEDSERHVQLPGELGKTEEPLEKGAMSRLAPNVDPHKETDEQKRYELSRWIVQEERQYREKLPHGGGPLFQRALHVLRGTTPTRRGKTGELEYLLHRGVDMHGEPVAQYPATNTVNHPTFRTSWSPDYLQAQAFASGSRSKVLSAWIPESKIVDIPKRHGALAIDTASNRRRLRGKIIHHDEHEVIVDRNHFSQKATDEDVDKIRYPNEYLETRISGRAKLSPIMRIGMNKIVAANLMQQGRLKSTKPVEGTGSSVDPEPVKWAHHTTHKEFLDSIKNGGLIPGSVSHPESGAKGPLWPGKLWFSDNDKAYPVMEANRDVQLRFPWPDKVVNEGKVDDLEYSTPSTIDPSAIQVKDAGGNWNPLTPAVKPGVRLDKTPEFHSGLYNYRDCFQPYDYTHVLPKKLQDSGHQLIVHDKTQKNEFSPPFIATLIHQGQEEGSISADDYGNKNVGISTHAFYDVAPKINPDSETGIAMHDALYQHAASRGYKTAIGSNVYHQILAQKHGLQYSDPYKGTLDKSEQVPARKGAFKSPAFRHMPTGEVVESPFFHDMNVLPAGSEHEYEDGFVDHVGKFYTRDEAAAHVGLSDRHGESMNLRSAGQLDDGVTNDQVGDLIETGMLGKSEPADEGERLLQHPDPVERAMSLKMNTVQPHHVAKALRDPDETVWRAALRHPKLQHGGLMALMGMDPRTYGGHQLAALNHPLVDQEHLRELYHTAKPLGFASVPHIIRAIAKHPKLDPKLIYDMVGDGHGDLAVRHDHAGEDAIRYYLRMYLNAPNQKRRVASALLLASGKAPIEMVNNVLSKPQLSPEVIVQGAAANPNIDPSLITDWLSRGRIPKAFDHEAPVRAALVQNPQATSEHLLNALHDSNPQVRKAVFSTKSTALGAHHVDTALALRDVGLGYAAMSSKAADESHLSKLAAHDDPEMRLLGHIKTSASALKKFDSDLSEFVGLQKATSPEHFKEISKALDPEGAKLVDHKGQMNAHPREHDAYVADYTNGVLKSPGLNKVKGRKLGGGITRKLVYETSQLPLFKMEGGQYMVKPYNERIIRRIGGWMKHPHQGWAEVTHQALYHAGGIGNLHQKVFVAEHNIGREHIEGQPWNAKEHFRDKAEPMLVIRMDKGFTPVAEGQPANGAPSEKAAASARKIGLMDFLTNNMDRHGGNLMSNLDTGDVLAIDHSRSFQYTRPASHKWMKRKQFKDRVKLNRGDDPVMLDEIGPYIGRANNLQYGYNGYAINEMAPFVTAGHTLDERQMAYLEKFKPTFEWWGQVSPSIRSAMNDQLQHIKDAGVRAHIKRNFEARADLLDQMADLGVENFGKDWYRTEVRNYQPGELTDQEKDEQDWRKRVAEENAK